MLRVPISRAMKARLSLALMNLLNINIACLDNEQKAGR